MAEITHNYPCERENKRKDAIFLERNCRAQWEPHEHDKKTYNQQNKVCQ